MQKAAQKPKFGDSLKEFDFYKYLPKDLAEPTFIGASMSVSVMFLMSVLFFYNILEFLSYKSTSEIIIEMSEEDQFVS